MNYELQFLGNYKIRLGNKYFQIIYISCFLTRSATYINMRVGITEYIRYNATN